MVRIEVIAGSTIYSTQEQLNRWSEDHPDLTLDDVDIDWQYNDKANMTFVVIAYETEE